MSSNRITSPIWRPGIGNDEVCRLNDTFEYPPAPVLHNARLSPEFTAMTTFNKGGIQMNQFLPEILSYLQQVQHIKLVSGSAHLKYLFARSVRQELYVYQQILDAGEPTIHPEDEDQNDTLAKCRHLFHGLSGQMDDLDRSRTANVESSKFEKDWICLSPFQIQLIDFLHYEKANVPDNFSKLKYKPKCKASQNCQHTEIGRPRTHIIDFCCQFITSTTAVWYTPALQCLEASIRDQWVSDKVRALVKEKHELIRGKYDKVKESFSSEDPRVLEAVKRQVDRHPVPFCHAHEWAAIDGYTFDWKLRCSVCYCKYGREPTPGLVIRGQRTPLKSALQKSEAMLWNCAEDAALSVIIRLRKALEKEKTQ